MKAFVCVAKNQKRECGWLVLANDIEEATRKFRTITGEFPVEVSEEYSW